MGISEVDLLLFVNALDLPIRLVVLLIVVRLLVAHIRDVPDFWHRCLRALHFNFQGGTYDLLVALTVIFAGMALRSESAWEWWVRGASWVDAPLLRMTAGTVLTIVGSICLVRVLAPNRWFRWVWTGTLLVGAVFAAASVAYRYVPPLMAP